MLAHSNVCLFHQPSNVKLGFEAFDHINSTPISRSNYCSVTTCKSLEMAVSGSKRSDAWKFFEKTGSKNVTCKLCTKAAKQLAYMYHGGTTNLWDHLLHVHADKYKPNKRMNSQHTMDTSMRKCSGARTKVISELVLDVHVVTMDLWPLTIVEGGATHCLL